MGMRRKGNEWKKEVKVILSFLVKIKCVNLKVALNS